MDDKKRHNTHVTEERPAGADDAEAYLHEWKLVEQTEGLDDEEIVKEYGKVYSHDSSDADTKKNR
jgi:hypothetical protein